MGFEQFSPNGGWYFIGAGGVSMSALALLLHDKGFAVRGYDDAQNSFTRNLERRGVPVYIGTGDKITEENVVYTGAVDRTHPQLAAAEAAGKRLFPRAELLGRIAEEYPFVLSVAGCHGKTSTTSMLAHIFYCNGRKFACHIGGQDALLGNYYSTGSDYFLTEACEFQRSFLSLTSTLALITNTDRDHTDCYADDKETFLAYREFAAQAKTVVVNAEERARTIPHALSFGFKTGDVTASCVRSDKERYSFTVCESGNPAVRIRLNVTGKYQILNALAAYGAARLSGFSAEEIKKGLESFRGVKRRFERVGEIGGVPVVCDYAHHPRELAAVLESAKRLCDGTVRLVFQPHTYTRTRDFMQDFVSVLSAVPNPVIYKTYSAREEYLFEGSAAALASKVKGGCYEQTPEGLKNRLLATAQKNDLVLVLGAGDIYETVKGILD